VPTDQGKKKLSSFGTDWAEELRMSSQVVKGQGSNSFLVEIN
jgi:hypothetical protein